MKDGEKMKKVFLLVFLHEEDGIQDPRGVFSSKAKLRMAIKKMKSDLNNEDLKEGEDFEIYEVPLDEA